MGLGRRKYWHSPNGLFRKIWAFFTSNSNIHEQAKFAQHGPRVVVKIDIRQFSWIAKSEHYMPQIRISANRLKLFNMDPGSRKYWHSPNGLLRKFQHYLHQIRKYTNSSTWTPCSRKYCQSPNGWLRKIWALLSQIRTSDKKLNFHNMDSRYSW